MSKSRSISAYCAWFIALLASPYAVLFHIGLCFWVRFTVYLHQHSVWVALTCTKLVLTTVIMVYHRQLSLLLRLKVTAYIFSIVFAWCRSDLFIVSLQITGYVILHNQMPLHITLGKKVFTSHCVCFHYIVICPGSSAYNIGVTSFAWSRCICCGLWTGHYFSFIVSTTVANWTLICSMSAALVHYGYLVV